jgi:predicted  nucleic acid-binding Zn-ribbon protein
VKADPTHQRLLLEIQEIDNHIQANKRSLSSIAEIESRKGLEAQLHALGPAFIAAKGLLEDTRSEIARIEDDVRLVETRLSQDVERRDHSSSAKDIAGFEHEIVTLNTRREQLVDAELVVMQRLEDAEKELESINEVRTELSAQIAQLNEGIEARIHQLEAEASSLSHERAVVVAKVPAELAALYEKQRERYGVGAALLTRGVSGGSGVALTASDLDAVRHAAPDDVILCPDSSCILVRTEESGL